MFVLRTHVIVPHSIPREKLIRHCARGVPFHQQLLIHPAPRMNPTYHDTAKNQLKTRPSKKHTSDKDQGNRNRYEYTLKSGIRFVTTEPRRYTGYDLALWPQLLNFDEPLSVVLWRIAWHCGKIKRGSHAAMPYYRFSTVCFSELEIRFVSV